MGTIAFQITSLAIVFSTVYLNTDQRKHQSSASLAFVWGIHRGPVNSPHKWPVTRKMFPFDDVIMNWTSNNLSPFDSKIACLCQSVEINNSKHVYLLKQSCVLPQSTNTINSSISIYQKIHVYTCFENIYLEIYILASPHFVMIQIGQHLR